MKKLPIYIFALIFLSSFAQKQKEERRVHLLYAKTLSFDKTLDVERQVLRGDVQFRQDSVYMYCDSAYFWESTNSMQAFSNVRMIQGDTLSMTCDSMSYDGDMLLAKLYDNVTLRHNHTILTTDYLTYDRVEEVAHYPYDGTIADSCNHLMSMMGWYYTNNKDAVFNNDVQLRSYDFSKMEMEDRPEYPDPESKDYGPRAILYSDTLFYNFTTSDAKVTGPSRIVTDTATVYTTLGFYNTSTLQSRLYNRSSIVSPGRFAIADSLYYDGTLGVGDGWGDIVMVDTIQSMKLTGEYMHYIDDPQSVMVTDKALAIEFSDKDTLYLHGDTLKAITVIKYDSITFSRFDTIPDIAYRLDTVWTEKADSSIMELPETVLDSIKSDSLLVAEKSLPYRLDSIPYDTIRVEEVSLQREVVDTLRYMLAYYGVRYYRSDMQGVCDSLHYSVRDSMATFVGNPVMWNEAYQITGDTIFAFINENKKIKRAEIHNAAFLVQEKDTFTMHEIGPKKKIINTLTRAYDQIKGKDLVCYFDSAKIKQMDMSGNVQVIYYPLEKDGGMTGLNQIIGNYLSVWFKEQKMDKLKIWPSPVGSLTPIQLVQPDILTLEGFRWMDYLRPKDPEDVFRLIEMSEEDKVENVPLFNQDELNGY